MIQLGDLVLEFIPAKGGDAGWSDHWEVRRPLGKRFRLLGYAVNLEGAIRIAVMGALDDTQRGVARNRLCELSEILASVRQRLCTDGPGDPAKALEKGRNPR